MLDGRLDRIVRNQNLKSDSSTKSANRYYGTFQLLPLTDQHQTNDRQRKADERNNS
ncbi:MAG: hypothetical protein JWM88_1106 [Verrucomicrobia bacterium]|nr:hypothetical protein [Verrucomicrobiota bacterium]